MKILVLIVTAFLANAALYTSSDFVKRGFDMSSPIKLGKPILNDVSTSCNNVALDASPYNYSGIVKSGYLSTGRGKSALAFIFYGKENASISAIKTYPTIIWLNGGPGSSSQLGNLM